MPRPKAPPAATEAQVRALLAKYQCPVPLHAVRTRMLGRIASPAPEISPIEMVKALWGGSLPEFDSSGSINELLDALLMGLWNQLAMDQERAAPIRLTQVNVPPTRAGLAKLARTRLEELEGFTEGLFGDAESLDLPEQAHTAVKVLSEIRAMPEATAEVAINPNKPGTQAETANLIGTLHEVARIAEIEMQVAVQSCTRARRQRAAGSPPVLH
jgi:hypothetical protein